MQRIPPTDNLLLNQSNTV